MRITDVIELCELFASARAFITRLHVLSNSPTQTQSCARLRYSAGLCGKCAQTWALNDAHPDVPTLHSRPAQGGNKLVCNMRIRMHET